MSILYSFFLIKNYLKKIEIFRQFKNACLLMFINDSMASDISNPLAISTLAGRSLIEPSIFPTHHHTLPNKLQSSRTRYSVGFSNLYCIRVRKDSAVVDRGFGAGDKNRLC